MWKAMVDALSQQEQPDTESFRSAQPTRRRKAPSKAYADRLYDRERARWQEAGQRSGEDPVQHLMELFIDVAVDLASSRLEYGQPQKSATSCNDQMRTVRVSRRKPGREFRALVLQLAVAANATDAEGLADILMTLWVSATSSFESGSDSRRLARHLPALVDQIIRSYIPGRPLPT